MCTLQGKALVVKKREDEEPTKEVLHGFRGDGPTQVVQERGSVPSIRRSLSP